MKEILSLLKFYVNMGLIWMLGYIVFIGWFILFVNNCKMLIWYNYYLIMGLIRMSCGEMVNFWFIWWLSIGLMKMYLFFCRLEWNLKDKLSYIIGNIEIFFIFV